MHQRSIAALLAAAATGVAASLASAQPFAPSTAFTYQGVLTENGTPLVSGLFEFKLFDAESGGTQVGSTFQTGAVTLEDGVFSADLDFGVDPFAPNTALWLEVAYAPSAIDMFTALGRQPITASPYALNTRGIDVDASGNVFMGAAPGTDIALHLDNSLVLGVRNNERGLFQTNNAGKLTFVSNNDTRLTSGSFLRLQTGGMDRLLLTRDTATMRLPFIAESTVGIGTDMPAAQLEVNTDRANDGVARFQNSNAAGFSGVYFDDQNGSLAGFIGHVNEDSGFAFPDTMQIGANFGDLVFNVSTNQFAQERMRITSAGRVGIADSDPSSTLSVNGTTNITGNVGIGTLAGAADDARLRLQIPSPAFRGAGAPVQQWSTPLDAGYAFALFRNNDDASNLVLWSPSGTSGFRNAMGVTPQGDVMLGSFDAANTSPRAKLDIETFDQDGLSVETTAFFGGNPRAATFRGGDVQVINGNVTVSDGSKVVTSHIEGNPSGTSGNPGFLTIDASLQFITGSLALGRGVISNSTQVEISSASALVNILRVSNFSGSAVLDVQNSGTVLVNGNVVLTSDARFKHNVETIAGALDMVRDMRGVTFEWNEGQPQHGAGEQIGFIAQEIEAIAPQLVNTAGDGTKSVAYANVAAVLVEAIKEQQQQIDALTNDRSTLTARIARLEAMVETMSETIAATVNE